MNIFTSEFIKILTAIGGGCEGRTRDKRIKSHLTSTLFQLVFSTILAINAQQNT